MVPVFLLLGSFALSSLISAISGGRYFSNVKFRARLSLSLMFVATGISHFANSEQFVMMIPPLLPFPEWINAGSGVLELVLAVGLLSKRIFRITGAAAAVFLVLIFPANIYNALAGNEVLGGLESLIPYYLWLRLLLQPFYIAWTLWCTRE